MTPTGNWKSVPDELTTTWYRIFSETPGDHNVDADCPVCGQRELHRYYQVGRPLHQVSDGITFVARGAGWEWCSACRTFEHYSALVPDWWSSDLVVDESGLTAIPDVLEHAIQREQDERPNDSSRKGHD